VRVWAWWPLSGPAFAPERPRTIRMSHLPNAIGGSARNGARELRLVQVRTPGSDSGGSLAVQGLWGQVIVPPEWKTDFTGTQPAQDC
jgi:hypothetical protein